MRPSAACSGAKAHMIPVHVAVHGPEQARES